MAATSGRFGHADNIEQTSDFGPRTSGPQVSDQSAGRLLGVKKSYDA
jgi:hypothetical protein